MLPMIALRRRHVVLRPDTGMGWNVLRERPTGSLIAGPGFATAFSCLRQPELNQMKCACFPCGTPPPACKPNTKIKSPPTVFFVLIFPPLSLPPCPFYSGSGFGCHQPTVTLRRLQEGPPEKPGPGRALFENSPLAKTAPPPVFCSYTSPRPGPPSTF